jgi:hypothetical protein
MILENTVFNDIRKIIDNIEIKFSGIAATFEPLEVKKLADRYVSAKLQQDSFATYFKFTTDVLHAAGITNVDLIELCLQNKYNIPANLRDTVVLLQRQKILNEYVEYNNYYRKLAGLPNYKDTDLIYISDELAAQYNFNNAIPIHEFTDSQLYILEMSGDLQAIKDLYPTKLYLNYIGRYKIDPSVARPARNFSIIRYFKDSTVTITETFIEIYDQCREYFMNVVYIPEFSNRYKYYDNFIGMMILVMTIQRFLSLTFKRGIIRDFFDIQYVKYLFESYKVPFIEALPIEYQVSLMRKLNILLQNKSTNKVLFDLCEILDFGDMEIYKYYLIKQHKLDINENPIFVYKTIQDDQGNDIVVEDKEAMFDFYFQKVNVKDSNIVTAIRNTSNKLSYDEVTLDDPYWIEDENLYNRIYDEEFNLVETKYFGLTAMYKMTKMLFEVMYFFRMILDKKNQLNNVFVYLYKITGDKPIKIFDSIILMCALFCKKNSMVGNVLYSPTKIMSVYGFNFKEDFDKIRQFVLANPKLVKPSILNYFSDLDINNPNDVNRLYDVIHDFNDFIVEQMSSTQDLDTYKAYQTIFKSLMVTMEATETFNKSDGNMANTFMEYLQDQNIDLYNFVLTLDKTQCSTYMEHVLRRINKLVVDLKYFYIINDNNLLLEALKTLIAFFKSYTVDLAAVNIVYLFDSRYYNKIKLLKKIHLIKTLEKNDLLNIVYMDNFSMQKDMLPKDYLDHYEKPYYYLTNQYNDLSLKIPFHDKMTYNKLYPVLDILNLNYNDIIKSVDKLFTALKDKYIYLKELAKYSKDLYNKELQTINERNSVNKNNKYSNDVLLYNTQTTSKQTLYKDYTPMRDSLQIIYES